MLPIETLEFSWLGARMRGTVFFASITALLAVVTSGAARAEDCLDPSGGLGVSRVVEIDTSTGALYGDMSKFVREESFLGPKEIVLTFDDGPLPWITKSILDTLDQFCTKATFFSVGQMALAYPEYSKEVLARGHTLGAHTWSHPMNLGHMNFEKAKDQIERGFAAVELAAGQPIAPFFRFPGLNDSDALLGYLQTRGIAAFTVDVVSNDSYIASPSRLLQRTIAQVEQRNGGIVLFHDIKASTAHALADILNELKARGYKVVHIKAKTPAVSVASYTEQLAPIVAKAKANKTKAEPKAGAKTDGAKADAVKTASTEAGTPQLRPFYGSATLLPPQGDGSAVPVTELAPHARTRVAISTASISPGQSAKAKRAKHLAAQQVEEEDLDRAIKPARQKVHYKQTKKAAAQQAQQNLFPF